MAQGHLLLAGNIAYAGGVATGPFAVADGATGASLSSGVGAQFESPGALSGMRADGAGGFVVWGRVQTGFPGMARYLDSGTVDPDFSVVIDEAFPPSVLTPVGSEGIYSVIQHGTGWLVRGNFTELNGVARNGFARLNADGSVDTDWPSPNTAMPTAIALQDGKAVIAADGLIYRVDDSGVDDTFVQTPFPEPLTAVHVTAGNKLVVTGAFASVGASARTGVHRVSAAAAEPDATMPELSFLDGSVLGVAPHDGGTLIFGSFTQALGGTRNRIIRLNSDLSVDTGFAAPTINGNILHALELQSGKILIVGTFTTVGGTTRQRVAVLNTNGTLDTGWVPPTVNGVVQHAHQAADGKIYLLAAYTSASGFTTVGGQTKRSIARLNANGTIDSAYTGPATGGVTRYFGIVQLSDDKMVLWGDHDSLLGAAMSAFALVDQDGPVSGFSNLAPNGGAVTGVVELASGKFLIAGGFTSLGGHAYSRVARLNADGTVDTTYTAVSVDSAVADNCILPLASGKWLLFAGSSLYRFAADGTLDGTYTSPAFNDAIAAGVRRPDGKIVLLGHFTTVSSTTRVRMCAVDDNGDFDASFGDVNLTVTPSAPRLFALDDNRVVVLPGNNTHTIGGHSRGRLSMVNADGTVDATWNPNPNNVVGQVRQQSDGKIIVSGNFSSIGGTSRTRLARLNADGTCDTSFSDSFFPTSIVDFAVDPDDYIVHAGSGTNTSNNYIARLDPDGSSVGGLGSASFSQTVSRIIWVDTDTYLLGLQNGSMFRVGTTGVDTTWNAGASGGAITDIHPVSDDRFVIRGGFTTGLARAPGRLTQLNADGSLDLDYPGLEMSPFTLSGVYPYSDDELLLIWSNGQRFRRSTAGVSTAITSFTPGNNVRMAPDGKIYQIQADSPFHLMRLNADHTDDEDWGTVAVSGTSLAYYPDTAGNGLFAATASASDKVSIGGTPVGRVGRLNADGSVDDSWVGDTHLTIPNQVFEAGSGKLYVVSPYTESGLPFLLVQRVASDGAIDEWASSGTNPVPLGATVAVDPDDHSVAGWNPTTDARRWVVKVDAAGELVEGYGTFNDAVFDLTAAAAAGPVRFLGDGRLLVTGQFAQAGGLKRSGAVVLDETGAVEAGYDAGLVSGGVTLLDVRDGQHYLGASVRAVGARAMPYVALREASGEFSADFLTEPYINPGATIGFIAATVNVVRALPDGRAYVGGRFATLGGGITFGQGGYAVASLARILPDGSADTSFGNAQIHDTENPPPPQATFPGIIYDIDVQADGALVVVGAFTMAGGRYGRSHVCRVSDAGVLDVDFYADIDAIVHAVRVRGDGKVWVGGEFEQVDGSPHAGVARLNADGSVDAGFADPEISVGELHYVHTLLPQNDGSVIVAGTFDTLGGVDSKSLRKLSAAGVPDDSWDPGITEGPVSAAAQDSDGRIYVGAAGAVFRLLATGAADTTWANPFGGTDVIKSIVPLTDGTVLVAGAFVLDGHHSVVMLGATGAPVADLPPRPLFQAAGAVAVVNRASWVPEPPMTLFPRQVPAGRIYAGREVSLQYRTYGGTKPYRYELVGGLPTGMAMDGATVEGQPPGGTHYWRVIARDATGARASHLTRLAVSSLDMDTPLLSFAATGVYRVEADGSDQTTLLSANGAITNAIRLPDRKILLLGDFTQIGGQTRNKVARLNPDGSLDSGFTGPASPSDIVGTPLCADMLPGGKFIVGTQRRSPTPYLGTIQRLNANGTIDTAYELDERIAMLSVQFIKVLEPDVVLVGGVVGDGSEDRYNLAAVFLIDADGAIDEAYIESLYPEWGGTLPDDFFTSLGMYELEGGFSIGTGAYFTTGIYDVHVDEEGHFLVCGSFVQRAGFGTTVTSRSVARAFRHGGHDTSFSTDIAGIVNEVNFPSRPMGKAIFPQPDGSFVVIGAFKAFDFTTTGKGYAHFDRNGDAATPPESWASAGVAMENESAMVLPDGRILTTGYGGNVRIFPDGTLDASFTEPSTMAARFLPDNDGIEGFTSDGLLSIKLESSASEPPEAFSADSYIELTGGSVVEPDPTAVVAEAIHFGTITAPLPIIPVRELVRLIAARHGTFEGTARGSDRLVLGDDPLWTVFALLEDLVLFEADGTGHPTAIARALERLVLSGQAANVAQAYAALVDALVLRELAQALHMGIAADSLLTRVVVDTLYHAFALALDRVLLAAAADGVYSLTVLVEDRAVLVGELAHEAELAAVIADAVGFAMSLAIDDGQYIAWVMNTQTKGLSRYTQYPFNSFGRVGGRYVGCAADGLHWLDADDDNGEAIHAVIRTSMDALGTRRAKRLPEAFIGYSSSGTLILKVILTGEESGQREAAYYRLPLRPAESKRENRAKLGRGLKAVDYAFVIENADGADFEIDSIEFRPINLDRRTRG